MNYSSIILIGNYLPDKQESMIRFARMLHAGFCRAGIKAEIWWPTSFFGRSVNSPNAGIGKWLCYLDKYILFPLVLRWRLRKKALQQPGVRFHICDHSNAPYLKYLPAARTGITCHDVIAIRGAMGYPDAYQPTSFMGKFLQKWILHYLCQAKFLASVSQLTLDQLKDLVPEQEWSQHKWRLIYNAFNAEFKPMEESRAEALVKAAGVNTSVPFLLHVGSGEARKNRKLLLDMVSALGERWKGNICFAGESVDKELMAQAVLLGLQDRVVSVVKPEHNTLVALYSTCAAFIFPSLSEGFGWPVIEAQACGAPVIASNREPMPEVSGNAALHADPTDPGAFAEALLLLYKEGKRAEVIKKGFENAKSFEPTDMVEAYLNLHEMERAIA